MKHLFQGVSITTLVLSIWVPSIAQGISNSQNTVTDRVPINSRLLSQAQTGNFDYKDFNFWVNQCRVLENEQNYPEALAACEQAIALQPKVKNPQLWASRSNVLFQLKKYAEAIASYDFLLSFSPKDSLAWLRRCEALYQLGKYENAIASCEQALRIDGSWGNASPADSWYNRGLAQRKLGQNEAALTSFERVLTLKSDNALALVQRCGTLTDLGRYEEAIASCDLAKDTLPVEALTNKAIAQQKAGKLQDAIASYDQVLAINPNDATAWTNQAIILEKLDDPEKALISYNRAVKINPKSSLAQVNRCAILNKQGNYKEAFEACEGAIAGDGIWGDRNPAYVWYQSSSALNGLGQYQEAITSAERAININPELAEAWNNKGVSFWHLQKYQNSLFSFQKAVEINPKYSQAWFNQGRILSALKEFTLAVEAYDKALSNPIKSVETLTCNNILSRSYEQPTENIDKFEELLIDAKIFCANVLANKSVALRYLEDYENALTAATQATNINYKSFEAWYNLGIILVDLQQYNAALDAYNQAESLSPNNFYLLTSKGIALERMGEDQKALEAFDAALNIDPDYEPAQYHRDLLVEKFKLQTE